ncbi:MAG: glycosyltransferase [Nocardioidaceae bacterium]
MRFHVSQAELVTAVCVTWNRRDLLTESLTAVARQSSPPHRVVVVDNASEDGTSALVRSSFPEADLVVAARNTGGAGGFAIGIGEALKQPCDLLWLMDDDTVPESGALQALLEARAHAPQRPVLVASRVLWTDGRDHPMNTPRTKPWAGAKERSAARRVDSVPIRSASFVSVLVEADAVRESGLPIADYFLWNDDFEFTTRLARGRRALYCPDSIVIHKTRTFGATDADPGARFYYEVRNKVWLFSRSSGLAPAEKLVYAASTLLRWARTLGSSSDRRALLRAAARGLAHGLRGAPRATPDVIAEATVAVTPPPLTHEGDEPVEASQDE